MAIDPRLYEKYSGRSGDPYKRLGEALAKNSKAQSNRDAMPKGVTGGLNIVKLPGVFLNLWFWIRNRRRERDDLGARRSRR